MRGHGSRETFDAEFTWQNIVQHKPVDKLTMIQQAFDDGLISGETAREMVRRYCDENYKKPA
jgi:hypothetical protein